ncbi:MAG: hypothetical protein ACREYB_06605 [Casimicrobiaceae bacterium]
MNATTMTASNTRARRRVGHGAVGNSISGMTAARDRRATIVDEALILLQPAAVFAWPMDLGYKSRLPRNPATSSMGPQ